MHAPFPHAPPPVANDTPQAAVLNAAGNVMFVGFRPQAEEVYRALCLLEATFSRPPQLVTVTESPVAANEAAGGWMLAM